MTRTNWGPGTLLELSGIYWQTCALHAAVRLDLFTEVGEEGEGAEELATRLGVDRRGLTTLLDALVAIGLLRSDRARYGCPPDVHALLSRSSSRSVGQMILHHANLMESWARLHESVCSGEPVRCRAATADEAVREAFLLGMVAQGRLVAPLVSSAIDLRGRTKLIDLGGGPGAFAIEFCRAFPWLSATVFDLPETSAFAHRLISDAGMADRVDFVGGDFLADRIPGGFDVAWLSHILHGESPERCGRLVKAAAKALEPGGLLLIHEFILEESAQAPLFPALFSLNMLVGTDGGRSYRESELRMMMGEAGLVEVRRLSFEGPSQSGILMGEKIS